MGMTSAIARACGFGAKPLYKNPNLRDCNIASSIKSGLAARLKEGFMASDDLIHPNSLFTSEDIRPNDIAVIVRDDGETIEILPFLEEDAMSDPVHFKRRQQNLLTAIALSVGFANDATADILIDNMTKTVNMNAFGQDN